MSRELKFRVYISEHGKFCYFNFNEFDYSDRYLSQHQFPVQQYAGKKDALDNEIYEGDIVYLNHYDVPAIDMDCLFEIIFDDGAFKLKPIKLGKPPTGGVSFFHWLKYITGEDSKGNPIYRFELPPPAPICGFNRMRVIGNTIENPELLK